MIAQKNSTVRGLDVSIFIETSFSHRKTNGKNLMETVNVNTGKARIQSTDSKSNSKQEANIVM